MKKRGLSDIKHRNHQVILQTVMENGSLSRVEIAQKTGLAASTTSSLVGELLNEGILVEAGMVSTPGRSRTALTINPDRGSIAIVEIGRNRVLLNWFNLALEKVKTTVLSNSFVSGNELLTLVANTFISYQQNFPPLVGIGLLLQEDMRESDFNVVYSTGLSSANITLREALFTQFRVPVEEEYSISYTVSNALTGATDQQMRNCAYISIGSRIMANVKIDGELIPIRDTFCEELAVAIDPEGGADNVSDNYFMAGYLEKMIMLLCIMFSLDAVYLSAEHQLSDHHIENLHDELTHKLSKDKMPLIKLLKKEPSSNGCVLMAQRIRNNSILAL